MSNYADYTSYWIQGRLWHIKRVSGHSVLYFYKIHVDDQWQVGLPKVLQQIAVELKYSPQPTTLTS